MTYYADDIVTLHHGDCLDVMATLPDESVDAIVTDPPYGLGFMGKDWDDLPPGEPWARECLRVLKPGGHMLAFGGTRTAHRLACAIEDAGFEIRDTIAWLYGSGFPKSLDVSKAIDKAAGAQREVIGTYAPPLDSSCGDVSAHERVPFAGGPKVDGVARGRQITAPATDPAKLWVGWGTALKPANEPIVVARKSPVGTVAANVLAHGTGALNIDGCRTAFVSASDERESKDKNRHADFDSGPRDNRIYGTDNRSRGADGNYDAPGRWPTNVALDPDAAAELDRQSGTLTSSKRQPHHDIGRTQGACYGAPSGEQYASTYGDSGGASRFFPTFRSLSGHGRTTPTRRLSSLPSG